MEMRSNMLVLAFSIFLSSLTMALAGEYETAMEASAHGDWAAALKILRPLAQKGDLQAEIALGDLYDAGHGVAQDYSLSMFWLQKAANNGSTIAQLRLGDLYFSGREQAGIAQSFPSAAAWYQKAAEKGDVRAQIKLGKIYEEGLGLKKDYILAHMWFNLAASKTEPCPPAPAFLCDFPIEGEPSGAAIDRDRVAKLMTAEQIAKAQNLASNWSPH